MSPQKKVKFAVNTDDSVTEPESDDSVTEPESDSDDLPDAVGNAYIRLHFALTDVPVAHQSLCSRPAFIRKPDQPPLGPLTLDSVQGIKVPAGINTFLREYQRDGIRFFWKRYQDGYGGVLGDDMGLVSLPGYWCGSLEEFLTFCFVGFVAG